MVALAFEERGISVVSVGNGEAAVRRIPDMNPDLVLADVFMPVRNGYEVCEFIKKDERFAHVPVILLVGAFDPLDEKEARRVGADGVLKKPFVPPDPLIAMVTSALEKNPKLAAELAKARETPKEPELPPMPIMEAPAKREPAPLPDFPEPTPEEAAQIYGFGKGVRALGDENVKEGPAPVAAKKDEEEGEEFDGASTTSDWRRTSGMDLEVPEGTTVDASHDFTRGFSGGFTPERQTAAQRSAGQELDEIGEPIPQKTVKPDPLPEPATSFFAPPEKPAPETSAPASVADSVPAASFNEEPVSPSPSGYNPLAPVSAVPEAQFVKETTKFESQPMPPASTDFESMPPPHPTHWMDMMAPSPSPEHLSSGAWMTEFEQQPEEAQAPVVEAEPAAVLSPQDSSQSLSQPFVQNEPPPAVVRPEPEVPFFTDEPKAAAPAESWFSVPPPIQDVIQEQVRQVVSETGTHHFDPRLFDSRPAPDFGHEIVLPHTDPESSRVEEPSPEPANSAIESLFSGTPAPGTRQEPPSFASSGRESAGSYHFQEPEHERAFEPEVEETQAQAESVASQPAEPEGAIFSERIPTGPPPNREALADIPFLQPPPPPAAPSTETVDAVVARVLERLEPQLHNLLSQSVLKPLVENLLAQELQKKDK
jgi:CheY-like chemotaxis protein